jgi:hypothetical protein
MATGVLLTIDTELAWRHRDRGAEEAYRRSCEPAGVGLGYQLEMLARHGLKACFFVDPMPALRFGIGPVRRMVETALAGGQEVQLHLHPVWARAEGETGSFELSDLSAARQREMIETARGLLMEAGAAAPIAFRAGSYAANDDTLDALRDAGIRFDSSFNASHPAGPRGMSLPPRQVAPAVHRGIAEIPVGQLCEGNGSLRHLQVCAVTLGEMSRALDHARREEQAIVAIVSHSFELATRDGLRVNKLVRRRFDGLCRFLAENSETLPTLHFSDLGPLAPARRATPMPPSPVRRFGRMAAQLASNLVYERRL